MDRIKEDSWWGFSPYQSWTLCGEEGQQDSMEHDHVILHFLSCDDSHLDDAPFQKI